MKTSKILLFLTTFVICVVVHGAGPAGIVLFFRSNDEVYLLLADHGLESDRDRGWAAFGGAANEGEKPAETAARETEEETRGCFSRTELMKEIASREPVVDGSFALFFVEVDFVPALRIANNEVDSPDEAYAERGPYAWVPWSQIEQYLTSDIDRARTYTIDSKYLPGRRYTNWFWSIWLHNLRKVVEADALPWN